MKVQSFLIALTTTLLFWFVLAFLPGSIEALTNPINIGNPQLKIERASKFFPKESALTFHWLADSKKIPGSVTSITNNRIDKEALYTAKSLRNALFALAGLDFENELAEWIEPEISFALLNLNEAKSDFQWVMVLTSSKENDAKNFLERFWLKESLGGVDVNIKRYRGVSLIKSNQFTNSSNYNSLATALIDESMILIASDEATLKTSLNISQFDEKNQAGEKQLKDTIEKLNNGLALISLSPEILNSILELPKEIIEQKDFSGFTAALNQDKNNLILDGIFHYHSPFQEKEQSTKELDESLIDSTKGPAEILGILYSPYTLLKEDSQDPFRNWIARLISNKLKETKGVAPKAILALNQETLIWIREPKGWVIGTHQGSPSISNISEIMMQDNQLKSNLLIDDQEFEVWSKLIANKVNEENIIETELGVIVSKENGNNWWGENLPALQQRQKEGVQLREKQLEELNSDYKKHPFMQLALNEKYAQELLQNWKPWRILNSIAGGSLKTLVKGLALSIDSDWEQEDSSINLRANLQITS